MPVSVLSVGRPIAPWKLILSVVEAYKVGGREDVEVNAGGIGEEVGELGGAGVGEGVFLDAAVTGPVGEEVGLHVPHFTGYRDVIGGSFLVPELTRNLICRVVGVGRGI